LIAAVVFLTTPGRLFAQSPAISVQATGEHILVTGDTPESARQFALIAAHRQAVRDMVSALQSRVDLAPLQLTHAQLSAYVDALIDSDDSAIAAASPAASRLRVTLRASFPAAGILERLSALHKDEDAARAVFTAFMQSERLSAYIAEQTGRRGPALSNSGAAAIVAEQLKAATSWNAKRLIARGAAALARTELSTIGGRTPSVEGRRRAKEFIDGALALEPDSAEAHTLLGDWYVDAEQPDAAETEYRRAIAGNANYAPGRTKVAEALRLQGKFPEATTELREAIRIDPKFAQAHSDLGMILRAERKVPEAIAEYREAIRLDPRSTEALNGLAITLAGAGQPEEAVATFKAIVAIDPDSTIGYYNLATVLANLDRDVESAAALREVIRINPSHYNARYNLGELLRLEGKYDDSVAQFREYLRLAPETPQNRRNIERAKQFIQKFANP
jgi:tetratricopeptide (TPR) repeat protein